MHGRCAGNGVRSELPILGLAAGQATSPLSSTDGQTTVAQRVRLQQRDLPPRLDAIMGQS